ncbi:ICOS ligand-like [Echeneis naucrates]|uniref:ICOS ligand-like n=1 Tax=Echeneis naucrates TaxID=173247 RepID=UPI001113966D|nr:ICOS ligand-like [Echeneis naucrates]
MKEDSFSVMNSPGPQEGMPVALCRVGLFLCVLGVLGLCACQEKNSVLGIVGRPVSVPCFYPEILTLVNFSIEWRRGSEVVLRSKWEEDVNVEGWSTNSTKISADAALTGNLSLQLLTVDPTDDNMYYRLFLSSGENRSAPVCTVCLRVAASFSSPKLKREDVPPGDKTAFSCHSSGGFPEPAVYWLINDTEEPPEGSVRTLAASLPDSQLFNVTSHLTVNVSKDSSVSCIIENPFMNQTLTSKSYGVQRNTVVSRASQAMWIFSTGLCVVVGLMVMAGVAYQIHLDRISKRRKDEYNYQQQKRGYTRQPLCANEAEAVKLQPKETVV